MATVLGVSEKNSLPVSVVTWHDSQLFLNFVSLYIKRFVTILPSQGYYLHLILLFGQCASAAHQAIVVELHCMVAIT